MASSAPSRTIRPTLAVLGGVLILAAVGCDKGDSAAESPQQRAEQAAEARSERAGEGFVDQQIAGEVAEERTELARDVEEREGEAKQLEQRPAETAAEDLAKPGGAYPQQ